MAGLSDLSDDDLRKLYQSAPTEKSLSDMSDDELKSAYDRHPSTAMDTLKSFGKGLVSGLSGFGELQREGQRGFLGIEPEELPEHQRMTGAETAKAIVGENKPETTPGKIASTVGEFVGNPASYIGPGSMAAKAATAATGGVGSEIAGEATEGTKLEPYARFIGALLGGHAPGAAARVVTPNPMTPERRALIDALRGEGVTGMTAGTATGNKGLQYAESHLSETFGGGGGAHEAEREALGQYTAAAMRRVGEPNATRATPDVVDHAFNRIGGEFDRLTAQHNMHLDQAVQNDMLNTTINYHDNVNPMMRSPLVENVMNDISQWAGSQNGQLTGRQYQNTRSRLAAAARGSNDPQLSHALSEMTEALDDAMERSIAATHPRDSGAFGDARRQYRNMLVIERAATGPGERAAQGFISPAQLATATRAVMGRRAYARGQGDFANLAREGNSAMLPLPNSGTAPRQSIAHAIEHLGLASLLGAEGAHAGASMPEMLAMGLTGAAAPAMAGRALMSPLAQGYLRNQLVPRGPGTSPSAQALINALMQGEQ